MARSLRRLIRPTLAELRGNGTIELPGGTYRLAWGARHCKPQVEHARLFEMARGRACVFDVGAKVGITAMCMAGAMPGGTVFAFEASEASCFVIDRNIGLNALEDRMVAVNTTVGAASGSLCTYHWHRKSGRSGIVLPPKKGGRPIHKLLVSLDDFARQNGLRPDLVKIDVEGAEHEVLAGMQRIMREVGPDVSLELHAWPGMPAASNAERILALLRPLGYRMFWMRERRFLDDAGALAGLEVPRHVTAQARFLLVPQGRPVPDWVAASRPASDD